MPCFFCLWSDLISCLLIWEQERDNLSISPSLCPDSSVTGLSFFPVSLLKLQKSRPWQVVPSLRPGILALGLRPVSIVWVLGSNERCRDGQLDPVENQRAFCPFLPDFLFLLPEKCIIKTQPGQVSGFREANSLTCQLAFVYIWRDTF